ncbi:spore coat U domain-containing protein [Thermopetrobacter sp. TC1]|uniref:Csu type fimbrial protein n=1 Tax=Thermopetrobacter sp. TC1 TaxID=1495045 RepID=UPI0005713815|nr:spore coat U domain-containing protein [Thermopetrobacter sp. TC1]
MKKILHGILAAAAVAAMASAAQAASTVTSTFQTQITIEDDCEITSPTDMNFGSVGLLNSNVDATSTFVVRCTENTDYTIALDNGQNASGGTSRMANSDGTKFVTYELYQDSGRTTLWDDTNTVSSTGTGVDQTFTVYGRVPPQATPPAGTYTDTVTITVTY